MNEFWTIVIKVYYQAEEGFTVQMGDDGAPMPLVTVHGKHIDSTLRQAIKEWLEAEHILDTGIPTS